jgi:hypothetical protein
MRERLIWISAGLLGLLLAAALASATSSVTTPDVGLAGEPVSAGEALAPPATVPAAAPVVKSIRATRVKKVAKKAKKKAKKRTVAAAPKAAVSPLAAVAPPAATASPKPRKKAAAKPKASATIKPATRTRPKVVPKVNAPVLTTPTLTVDSHGGDKPEPDSSGDSSGKSKDGGGGDD